MSEKLSNNYDVAVVGARCAGSPVAMLLARKGYRVLLVDKAAFPSEKLSTHYIHQPGVARLRRWGLLDRLRETGCPPITKYNIDFGEFKLEGSPTPIDGVAEAFCPRRTILDKLLIDAAVEAGATFREKRHVSGLIRDGDAVKGMRLRNGADGVTEEIFAKIVVGADGISSVVARDTGAPEYNSKPALECAYYAYWRDLPLDGFEIYRRPKRMVFASSTHNGLACVGVAWTNKEFDVYKSDVEKNYLATIDALPDFAARVSKATMEEGYFGTSNLPNYFRRPYGDGWALAGDAGYCRDPSTAMGITDAWRDADLVAEAIHSGLSGERPMTEALADYESRRNEAVAAIYEFYTTHIAPLDPLPVEFAEFLKRLKRDQALVDRFCGAMAGVVPIQEVFSAENVMRVMGVKGLFQATMKMIWQPMGKLAMASKR
jgi:flavin-dependent dehydrogenase